MKDICNFIPAKDYNSGIGYYHFVYEVENHRLRQPFLNHYYRLYLVVKGTGVWKTGGNALPLEPGAVFFTRPYQSYRLTGTENFAYLYISFDGTSAPDILKSYRIEPEPHVYRNFSQLTAFWMESIRRFTQQTANAVTESVFMYTLSYLGGAGSQENTPSADKFQLIIDYLHNHFQNPELSLKSVASLFFYNEKYFSSLFKQKMQVNFSQYLNDLRIRHAMEQIEAGVSSISQLAAQCGFSDPLYFTKVFKSSTGSTPTAYIKAQSKSPLQD